MDIIAILDAEEMQRVSAGKTIPAFQPGDRVVSPRLSFSGPEISEDLLGCVAASGATGWAVLWA